MRAWRMQQMCVLAYAYMLLDIEYNNKCDNVIENKWTYQLMY